MSDATWPDAAYQPSPGVDRQRPVPQNDAEARATGQTGVDLTGRGHGGGGGNSRVGTASLAAALTGAFTPDPNSPAGRTLLEAHEVRKRSTEAALRDPRVAMVMKQARKNAEQHGRDVTYADFVEAARKFQR